jgi:hypothetical protein
MLPIRIDFSVNCVHIVKFSKLYFKVVMGVMCVYGHTSDAWHLTTGGVRKIYNSISNVSLTLSVFKMS